MSNEIVQVSMTKKELLTVIGALVKVQVLNGVKDDALANLAGSLSLQATKLLSNEELQEIMNG